MKKILAAVAASCAAVLTPMMAAAGPVYTLYQFQVLSFGCTVNDQWGCGGTYGPEQLNKLNVGIIGDTGMLNITTMYDVYPTVGGGTFEHENIAVADFKWTGTPLDFRAEKCMSPRICYVYADLSADSTSSFLTGSFYSGNDADTIYMESNGTSLWEGHYLSDNGASQTRHPVFTGIWIAVPEPATLALFGAGLIGLMGMRRSKAA